LKPGIAGNEDRIVEDIAKTLNRWKSIEGHARGVEKMIAEDAYCVDILKQTLAIQGAIEKVNGAILERHLNSCVTTAIQGDDPAERERVLAELMDVFRGSGHLKRVVAVGEVLGELADSLAVGNGAGAEEVEAK
jgi:DNA-binding FrmR family transcriptional regulator